jgi:glycerol-3-phosphate O-acyltransferase
MSARGADGWRLTPDDVERSPAFEAGLPALVARCARPAADVRRELHARLQALRTAHSPRVYRWLVAGGRRLMGSGYSRIEYDPAQVERLRETFATVPAVVLSSHRSYLDGGAFTVGFADHGLPALTVFAGANLDFWPIGTLWRRANAVLIPRAGPSPVDAFALRQCVGALVERRRPLQWFVEGTRSRSGLLGRARLGLLVYVVDAYREGRVDDVALLPASVAYDHLREVDEYAAAARGAVKRPETLGWLVRFVREQRGRHGAIHVRFGEPVSLRAMLGPRDALPPPDAPATRAALESLAREVLRRIDATTPVTATALVAGALLARPGEWTPAAQLASDVREVLAFLRERGRPVAVGELASDDAAVASRALDAVLASLRDHALVATTDDGGRVHHRIPPGRELQAAYHRNASLSHFVPAAVAARTRDGGDPSAVAAALHDVLGAFVDLGDLEAFVECVRAERNRRPLPRAFANGTIEPLLEAAATVQSWRDAHPNAPLAGPEALTACETLGLAALAAGRHRHPEAVSRALYERAARAG